VPVRNGCSPELPNGGRYTTHEIFIPSLVSASAAEFTRVARSMSTVPWQANPQLFTEQIPLQPKGTLGPHVSDMMALKYLRRTGAIEEASAGCGVVPPTQLLKGHCMSCHKAGAVSSTALAVHFSHYAMSHDADLPLLLHCFNRSGHPNVKRAACMAEAAPTIQRQCGGERSTALRGAVHGNEENPTSVAMHASPCRESACPALFVLERHALEEGHGFVCRASDSNFVCPAGCDPSATAPWCTSWRPTRARRRARHFRRRQ
jgi:hypothetical protein